MGPLEQFFRRYPWFLYSPVESASAQFKRLRREAGWKKGDDEDKGAWKDYRTALVRQFNSSFARDDGVLDAWHELLRHIGTVNPPPTVGECKTLISGKFINLVDLIDARDDPTVVIRHFPTETALSKYTITTGKFFPRNHGEAGGLLRFFLRHIQNPDPLRRDPGQVNRGRGKKRHHRP